MLHPGTRLKNALIAPPSCSDAGSLRITRALAEQMQLKTEASVELARLKAEAKAAAAAANAPPMTRGKSRRGTAVTGASGEGVASAPEFPAQPEAVATVATPAASEKSVVGTGQKLVGVPFTYAKPEEKKQEEVAKADMMSGEAAVLNPKKVQEQIALKKAEMEALTRQLAKIKAAEARGNNMISPEEAERQAAKAKEAKEKRLNAFIDTPSMSTAAALGIDGPAKKPQGKSPAKPAAGKGGGRFGAGGGGAKPSWL